MPFFQRYVCNAILLENCQTEFCNLAFDHFFPIQGCQIFLGTKYQNGEKYAKLPRTVPNVHKI
jgi:hypothetical protein